MSDNTQVSANIINEQLRYSFKDSGFSYDGTVHVNRTLYDASAPGHDVEQGSFTETIGNYSVTGKYTFTENAHHITDIADYSYSYGGDTYESKSVYTSNGAGYNLVDKQYINGDQVAMFHYQG